MNRSLTNVLFGGLGTTAVQDHKIEGTITKTTIEDTVDALLNADSVILVTLTTIIVVNRLLTRAILVGCGLWDGCGKSTVCY